MWTMALDGRDLATSAVMQSQPGDLFSEYFSMAYFTSFGVNGLTGRDRGKGEFRKVSTDFIFSLSIISECGWKV